mgnify:CR=1 FL=1
MKKELFEDIIAIIAVIFFLFIVLCLTKVF